MEPKCSIKYLNSKTWILFHMFFCKLQNVLKEVRKLSQNSCQLLNLRPCQVAMETNLLVRIQGLIR